MAIISDNQHLQAALECIENRDWASAVNEFEKIHADNLAFENDLYFALYSKALRNIRRYAAADNVAKNGLTIFGNSRSILNEFSWSAEKQKNWTLAVERLLNLLAASNGKAKPQVYQRLLKAMRASKQLNDAKAICLEVLSKYPESSIVRIEVAYTQRALGDLDTAITHLIYVVENLPDDTSPTLYKNLISWLRSVEDFERSDLYAEKALAVFGELALYHEYLLNAEKQKRWTEFLNRLDNLPMTVYKQDKAQFDRRRLAAYRKMKMEYSGDELCFVTETVLAILSKLRDVKVPHCLMRNFLFKQGGAIGSDIDLAVDHSDEKVIDEIMIGLGFSKRKTATDWYYFIYSEKLNIWLFIDLHDGSAFMTPDAFKVMASSAFYNNDGLPLPASGHYWGLLVLRELFKPGSLKPRHLEQLDYLSQQCKAEDFSLHAESLFSAIPLSGKQHAQLNDCIRYYLSYPDGFWDTLTASRWGKLPIKANEASKNKPLAVVCLVGIDGAGKTTAIENLKAIMPAKLPLVVMPMKAKSALTWFGKNRLIKFKLFGRQIQQRYLGAVFDFVDKYIRYKKACKKAAAKQGVVLFERWTADTTIAEHFKEPNQQKTMYIRFLYLLERLMPKPDTFIYLDLSVEEALKRKSEDSPEVIRFRDKHYKDFYGRQPDSRFIDACLTQQNLAYCLEREIYKTIQANIHRHLADVR
ncbi:hypothetical protein Q3O59_08085 [Alkalimonas delamerensis]|uniref:Thymidylate kinase-like domain-containing protein n=1 Tax=Alkalimonas delamerensis TaxID=265981 RepID=A0ABT9GQQ7_9GAMM|nr:hypothetical protein [Alkalimonas delamerensis]MDP4528986.1 hypothetical protein [Alkalimonas delamerensis]